MRTAGGDELHGFVLQVGGEVELVVLVVAPAGEGLRVRGAEHAGVFGPGRELVVFFEVGRGAGGELRVGCRCG